MTRQDRLLSALDAYDRADIAALGALFAPDARWLGVPGSGFEGETPI